MNSIESNLSRPNPNYTQVMKKSGVEFLKPQGPMKLADEQRKVKECRHSDFLFRSSPRPEPNEKISKVVAQKADWPSVKETKPDKLKTNLLEQRRAAIDRPSKISNRPSINYIEQGKEFNKNPCYENSLDDDNDGWITVKSNKSNFKKNLENLQGRNTSNQKLGKFSNCNKFISQQKPDSHENRSSENSIHNVKTSNKGVSFGKDFQEQRPNSSNITARNINSSKNFEKRISIGLQHNLHGPPPDDGDRKIFRNKPVIKKKEENSANLNDRHIYLESSEISKEREEKSQARLLKKMKIKEEKKRKREDKARLVKDNLRKDTKINMISQEMIEKFSKSTGYESVSNNYRQYRAPYSEEYPVISVNGTSNQHFQSNYKISHYQQSESKNMNRPKQNNKDINFCDESKKSPTSYSSATRNTDRSHGTDFGNENNLLEGPHQALNLSSDFEESTFEVKKKVKSKDRMNLAIMSLLEMKQREKKKDSKIKFNVEQKPVKPIIEKHGKIRENSKKKISVLKKNILREKKRREELLFSLLKAENSPVATETSDCEKPIILPIESEPNTATPITSPSLNVDQDAERPSSSPSSEAGYKASNSSKILSKDLSNLNEKILSSDSKKLMNISENQELNQSPHKIENSSIIKEINILMNPVHSKKFREYCDQIVTPEINAVISELIQLLVKFQDRLYQLDPLKAKIKRRFYCGLKESLKHMNRQVCIIMAPNLKPSPGPGCVDELVMKVLNKAAECGIPIVFGLTNRVIGRLCHKKVPVSCFSIVNYQGAQDSFNALMDLVPEAKTEYQKLLGSRGLIDCGQEDLEGEGASKENISSNEITDSLLLSLKVAEKTV